MTTQGANVPETAEDSATGKTVVEMSNPQMVDWSVEYVNIDKALAHKGRGFATIVAPPQSGKSISVVSYIWSQAQILRHRAPVLYLLGNELEVQSLSRRHSMRLEEEE